MKTFDSYIMSLAKVIATERKSQGISQEYLAELCDVHRNSIAMIELGKSDPTIVTFTNICLAFGISRLIIDHINCLLYMATDGIKSSPLDHSTVNNNIGFFIDSLRQRYDLSRERLSMHTGIHRNTIDRIENAKVTARVSTIIELYRYFRVTEAFTSRVTYDHQNDCTVYGVTLRCIDKNKKNNTLLVNDRQSVMHE